MGFNVGASGAWKAVPGASIGVSGVWKSIIAMYVGASGAWKNFYSSGLVGQLPDPTTYTSSFTGVNMRGYSRLSPGTSSISPSNLLADGMRVLELSNGTTTTQALLRIELFGANPGSTYLNFITVGSVTLLGSAAAYSFSGTVATWLWAGSTFSIPVGVGATDIAIAKN